jgi:hypothetical protein
MPGRGNVKETGDYKRDDKNQSSSQKAGAAASAAVHGASLTGHVAHFIVKSHLVFLHLYEGTGSKRAGSPLSSPFK